MATTTVKAHKKAAAARQRARAGDAAAPGPGEFSLTVSRALQLLATFAPECPEMGVHELSRRLSLSAAAVHRLLQALELHGFVEQNAATRKYRIGFQAFRVGSLYTQTDLLERSARPVMQALARDTGQTCYLGILREDRIIIVASVEGAGPIRFAVALGASLPLHCTATGKIALASMSDEALERSLSGIEFVARTPHTIVTRRALRARVEVARRRGYSVNWDEYHMGAGSVAAPIRDERGGLLGVISLGFSTGQMRASQTPLLGEKLIAASSSIAARMLATRPS